ncbi:MAG: hypothetical protein A4E64_00525 [Syntrophorhabdus sp. PtaU1.Bin058]|nr:MAG: hypothetical protein A4E64_00525 [Syntrophorhabdus sp. PtaU1.Bin058]
MSDLFDITGKDIAQLDDATLRELIGLLCEADYRLAGLSTKGITWSGHQDAKDGGLDVVVRCDMPPPSNSFIPRNPTGFQVKKTDMRKAKILKEMRPNDILREEIKTLMQEKGAYIIVSSSESTSNTAIKDRIDAMKETVANEANHGDLYLDFLDSGRVATWVRIHLSMILWVRNKIARQLKGWRPYENWSHTPGGIEEEYLFDDGLRLHDGTKTINDGVSVEHGIQRLRSVLSVPGASVRLAGLSGVGKTRLVQTLFDERIGKQALNRSQVIYADMSDSPNPDPKALVEQLISLKTRTILIVDNCPPDLHRRLTTTCSGPHSCVSLLSVEYDVREDLPEDTNVFRLEPASEEVIEKLTLKRFSHISQIDARTIAKFSGGNARLAIALANTVQHRETLSGFHDEELFKRLFQQRQDPNENLLISAEACSLVYSFEGEDANSEKSELKILASFINKSGSDLYRDVAILKKRDLIQSRGVWRAVLPHAIANRLAKLALESIPKDTILNTFLRNGSERLIKSFTRRLSYLHDCAPAVEIVNEWLAPDGWIGKANCNFNALGTAAFQNVAPVSPEKTLETIERAANGNEGSKFTSRDNPHYYKFVKILRHLAYDPDLFERSVNLLRRYALSETQEENHNSTRDILKSLFYIHLSGTHAPAEARAKVIKELMDSADQDKQELGFILLDAALETWHFSSHYDFEFGARPRGYGWYPRTHEDVVYWYKIFIDICTHLALSGKSIAEKARKILSDNLRGLWTRGNMFEVLENSIRQIHKQRAWNDAWVAVRGIIRHDGRGFEKDILEKLYELEKFLKPNDLYELARTYALTEQRQTFDLEDDIEDNEDASSLWKRVAEKTRNIGARVAQDIDTLNALLPELVSTYNQRLFNFGRGLADGCGDRKNLWQILRTQFGKTLPEKRQINVFIGFLSSCAENDPTLYNSMLDDLVNDELFGEWFPIFQTTSIIDQRGVERLHKALDTGRVKVQTFQYLAWGRAHESISDDDLADLLKKILSKENGIETVIEILKMRFYRQGEALPKYSGSLISIACDVLSMYIFPKERGRHDNLDYELAQIAQICFDGSEGINTATAICRHLAEASSDYHIYAFDYPHLLCVLARTQPFVFLNVFFINEDIEDYQYHRMFSQDSEPHSPNPLNEVSDEDLISWCDNDPNRRYPLIASTIQTFSQSKETGKITWKPIVYSIFGKAPDLSIVLEHLAHSIWPMGWSGSLADIMQKRSVLFQNLFEHGNTEISAWAKTQYLALQKTIEKERGSEKARDRNRDQSFE